MLKLTEGEYLNTQIGESKDFFWVDLTWNDPKTSYESVVAAIQCHFYSMDIEEL